MVECEIDVEPPEGGSESTTGPGSTLGRLRQAALGPRAALLVFVVALVATGPIVLFGVGRNQWFVVDEWVVLSTRMSVSPHTLFGEYNGHWTTVPVVLFRIAWQFFKLSDYRPYQALTVLSHLAIVALMRAVMRREGVGPWLATFTAACMLLLGAGASDIVDAWQVTFTLPIALGLGALLLTAHPGRWDRRDTIGLGLGAIALMCSAIGVAMVAVVAIAVLMRRGWHAALAYLVPLVTLFLVWEITFGRPRPGAPATLHARPTEAPFDIARVVGHALRGLGGLHGPGSAVVAVAIALLGGGGMLSLVWRHRLDFDSLRRALSVPVALLGGIIATGLLISLSRGAYGASALLADRYLYVEVALLLPLLAIGVQELSRHRRQVSYLCVALLAFGVPANVHAFNETFFGANFSAAQRQVVLTVARQPGIDRLPYEAQPYMLGPVAGWMRRGVKDGWLPKPGPVSPQQAASAALQVALVQSDMTAKGRDCEQFSTSKHLELERGDAFVLRFRSGEKVGPLARGVTMTASGPTAVAGAANTMVDYNGRLFTVYGDQLDLDLKALPNVQFAVCRPS